MAYGFMTEADYFSKTGDRIQMMAISSLVGLLVTFIAGGFGFPVFIWYSVTLFQIRGITKRASIDLNIPELKQFGNMHLWSGAIKMTLLWIAFFAIIGFMIYMLLLPFFLYAMWPGYYFFAPRVKQYDSFYMSIYMLTSAAIILVVAIPLLISSILEYQAWQKLKRFYMLYVGDPLMQHKGMKQSNNVSICAAVDLFALVGYFIFSFLGFLGIIALILAIIVSVVTFIVRLVAWFTISGTFKQLGTGPFGYRGGGQGQIGRGYRGPAYGMQPAHGGPSPAYGRPSPVYGRQSPAHGGPSPAYGRPSPVYGRQSPAYGEPSPRVRGERTGGTSHWDIGETGTSQRSRPEPKTCMYCGNSLTPDALFCGSCGTSIP